jgi:hypothetical protein
MKHLLLLLLVVMLPAVERGDPRGLKLLERHNVPTTTRIIPNKFPSKDFVICNSNYEYFQQLPGCLRELEIIKSDQNIFHNLTKAQIRDLFSKIGFEDSLYFMGHGIYNEKQKQYTILASDSVDVKDGVPISTMFRKIYVSACESNYFRTSVTSPTCKVYTSDLGDANVNDDDFVFARMFTDGQLSDGRYASYYKFVKKIDEDKIVSYDGHNFTVGYVPTVTEVVKTVVVEVEKSPESKQSERAKTKGIVEGRIQSLRKKLAVAEEKARSQDLYTRRFSDSQSAAREALTMELRAKCDKIRAEIDAYIMKNHDILYGGP